MIMYTMSQVETLTGIKSHTLRVWERRYNLLNPKRTDTNIRYYSEQQLKKLLNINILLNNGFRISKVNELDENRFNQLVSELSANYSEKYEDSINRLILCMLDLDEDSFNEVFRQNVMANGLLSTITNIIYPFLNQVGILWTTNKATPSQEHFISNLIRQKIITEIDNIKLIHKDAPKIVLFLSENENHEIGLLLGYFIAKNLGWKVYYLGQNVPLDNIDEILDLSKAKVVFSVFTAPKKEQYFREFKEMANQRDALYLVSGNYNLDYLSSNIQHVKSPEEFINQLNKIIIKSAV